jgi:hypothetical protein
VIRGPVKKKSNWKFLLYFVFLSGVQNHAKTKESIKNIYLRTSYSQQQQKEKK